MVHNLVFHNDHILPMERVRLSPGQAGVINGWGLFSTLRIYEGHAFAFERHWARLLADAARIQLPVEHTADWVGQRMQELIAANHVASGCVRIYFIYNKVGIWRSEESLPKVDLLMYTSDLPVRTGATRLCLFADGRHAAHPLAGVKVISWLANAWFLEQAHQRGCDDALLLNEFGNVSECTAANIFYAQGGQVITPPLTAGCLAGVSRQVLLEIGPAAGISIVERDFNFEQLRKAEEVFITSTTRQVQPVAAIDNCEYGHAPGPVTTRLAQLFSEYVSAEIAHASRLSATRQAPRDTPKNAVP